jgi:V8-like Glu-specific endopeptidase
MIVTRDGNPFELPPGVILVNVTATLIHPQVLLTAGHFTFFGTDGVPPFLRIVVSFSPTALDESTWISIDQGPGTQLVHPSFPPDGIDDIDGLPEAGVADVGLIFLDAPITSITPAKLAQQKLKKRDIGERMTVVGYGLTSTDGSFDGLRRIGSSTLETLLDQDWVGFDRDPVKICFGDSGGPTFQEGRIVAIVSDGAADCSSADWRARVDTNEVRTWIKHVIRDRFGHWDDD